MARELLRLRLPCTPRAPGMIRAALTDLQDLGWVLGDAMLVASELVTNAVRHSGCSETEELLVSIVANATLRITVTDPGISGASAQIAQRDMGFGGLGLRLIEQLVKAWGAERQPDGHVVWAELSLRG